MFINQKSVDNYLTEYRDIDLTFSCKHYKISLNVYKTLFMVTVYQLSDNAFWIPEKQETYDSDCSRQIHELLQELRSFPYC